MYASSSNDSGVLLSVFSGSSMSEADYEHALSDITRVDKLAAARKVPFVHVSIVEEGVPLPSPRWRKRFADFSKEILSEQYYFVMVTKSVVVRGMLTAILWMTDQRTGHHSHVVSSLDEAQRWLGGEIGKSYEYMAAMKPRTHSPQEQSSEAP